MQHCVVASARAGQRGSLAMLVLQSDLAAVVDCSGALLVSACWLARQSAAALAQS
jgi:hypothetical protein